MMSSFRCPLCSSMWFSYVSVIHFITIKCWVKIPSNFSAVIYDIMASSVLHWSFLHRHFFLFTFQTAYIILRKVITVTSTNVLCTMHGELLSSKNTEHGWLSRVTSPLIIFYRGVVYWILCRKEVKKWVVKLAVPNCKFRLHKKIKLRTHLILRRRAVLTLIVQLFKLPPDREEKN